MVACVQQNDIKEASLTKMGHTGTQVSIDEAESQLIASLEVLYPSTKNGVQRRIEIDNFTVERGNDCIPGRVNGNAVPQHALAEDRIRHAGK